MEGQEVLSMDLRIPKFRCLYRSVIKGYIRLMIFYLNDFYSNNINLCNARFQTKTDSITILCLALIFERNAVADFLLKYENVDVEIECNFFGNRIVLRKATALWCAAMIGSKHFCRLLLNKGADINHQDEYGRTPLYIACSEKHVDVVEYLLEQKAEVNIPGEFGMTALMAAAKNGFDEIVFHLLNNGADINIIDDHGDSALHHSAAENNLDICKILMLHKPNFTRNSIGFTPDLYAAENKCEEVVNYFIDLDGLSNEMKIDDLELLGSNLILQNNVEKGCAYFKRAMEMRFSDPENIVRKEVNEPILAYRNLQESQSIEEINDRYHTDDIVMEALIIRERILGWDHPFIPFQIESTAGNYYDRRLYNQSEQLLLRVLYLCNETERSAVRSLDKLVNMYCLLIVNELSIINPNNLLYVLEKCGEETNRYKKEVANIFQMYTIDDIVWIDVLVKYETCILFLLNLITIALKKMKSQDLESIFNSLKQLVKKIVKDDHRLPPKKLSILHCAASFTDTRGNGSMLQLCEYPCKETMKFLLECGASPYAVDCNKDTVIHTLVSKTPEAVEERIGSDNMKKMIEMMIEKGAHLDQTNNFGQKPADSTEIEHLRTMLINMEREHCKLECLAAQVIEKHRVQYDECFIPSIINNILIQHGTKYFSSDSNVEA